MWSFASTIFADMQCDGYPSKAHSSSFHLVYHNSIKTVMITHRNFIEDDDTHHFL